MPIEVRHDSGTGGMELASAAGFANGQVVGREQNRQYEIAYAKVKNEQAEIQASIVQTLIRANAAAAGSGNVSPEHRKSSSPDNYSSSSVRRSSPDMVSSETPQPEYESIYSNSQNKELERIANARDYVQQNPKGQYSSQEQENLMLQLLDQESNIVPTKRRKESPYPPGQDVGMAWMDRATGATMTRTEKGDLKVLVKPDDTFTIKNQLEIKKETIAYAKQLYEASQMTDSPIHFNQAMEEAQQFFTIDTGQTPMEIDPTIAAMHQQASNDVASNIINMTEGQQAGAMTMANGGQDDEESMADHILRQVMSPQTYQAAKQTGLPSKDIYYMAQQLSAKNKQTGEATNGDIKKSDWMANKESFGQYRKRFAAGTSKSQIETAYKNDPYIKQNNSALADPDHQITTEYATWEELTDSQRDKGFEAYKHWHSSLGFGGRLEHIAGDKTVERRIEEKNIEKKGKLLTKKQFEEKAIEEPEFLWNFFKINNNQKTLFDNVPTGHKGIDSGRLPVFGGING